MSSAAETRRKLETGLSVLVEMIRESPVSQKTGRHAYDGSISIKAVLRLGGIKSPATIHHAHHAETKRWLSKQVDELKALAGRGKYRKKSTIAATKSRNREEKLAQELAAAHYRIMELEAQLSKLSNVKNNKVVRLNGRLKKK